MAFNFPTSGTNFFSSSQAQTTITPSVGFGMPAPTTSTQSSIFNQPSTGLFGATQPQQSTGFSFGPLGQQPQQQQQPVFNFNTNIGQTNPPGSLFGPQPLQQQQPQQTLNIAPQPASTVSLEESVTNPKIFNDERDQVLGVFNNVLVQYGAGKAACCINGNFQQIDVANQLPGKNRLKAIGYSELRKEDHDDRVGLLVKFESEVNLKSSILSYENNLKTMVFGNCPVKVESVKVLPEKKCLLTISVTDPSNQRKMPANQLGTHLMSANMKNSLMAALQHNFIQVISLSTMSKHEVEEYLNQAPSGLDQYLWNQAKENNPDASRFIPVPLIGFQSLNERFKLEGQEVKDQDFRIHQISESILGLEKSVSATRAKLEECKKRNIPLKAKVLRLMTYHEMTRMRGIAIQGEEDGLRGRLEKINLELNAPTKFRGCLNELISRVRQMSQSQSSKDGSSSSAPVVPPTLPAPLYVSGDVDQETLLELKAHLKNESEAISHLLEVLRRNQGLVHKLTEK